MKPMKPRPMKLTPTDEAIEAIVTKEIEANAIDEIVADNEAIVSNEAGEADADKAIKAEANKAADEADTSKEDAEKIS